MLGHWLHTLTQNPIEKKERWRLFFFCCGLGGFADFTLTPSTFPWCWSINNFNSNCFLFHQKFWTDNPGEFWKSTSIERAAGILEDAVNDDEDISSLARNVPEALQMKLSLEMTGKTADAVTANWESNRDRRDVDKTHKVKR